MNFYLEEILVDGRGGSGGAGKRLIFPIIPDEVEVTSGANVVPLNIIKSGEVRIPRGEKATGYTWDGFLPGNSMKGASFINTDPDEWQSATVIVKMLEKWKKKGTPLKFVVGKFVNADVFIENFNYRYFGQNHCKYSITLTKYPTLTVSVSPAPKKTSSGTDGDPKAVGKYGKVNKDKVIYRNGPGPSYKKLGTLKKGTEVKIYAVSGNWYKIKEAGGFGSGGQFISGWGNNEQIARIIAAGYANLPGLTQDEWWVCATYITITGGKPTKKTPTIYQFPGSSGGGGSSGKKKKHSSSSHGGSGGKKHVTAKVPTSKRTDPKPTVRKPGPSNPERGGNRRVTQ